METKRKYIVVELMHDESPGTCDLLVAAVDERGRFQVLQDELIGWPPYAQDFVRVARTMALWVRVCERAGG